MIADTHAILTGVAASRILPVHIVTRRCISRDLGHDFLLSWRAHMLEEVLVLLHQLRLALGCQAMLLEKTPLVFLE